MQDGVERRWKRKLPKPQEAKRNEIDPAVAEDEFMPNAMNWLDEWRGGARSGNP